MSPRITAKDKNNIYFLTAFILFLFLLHGNFGPVMEDHSTDSSCKKLSDIPDDDGSLNKTRYSNQILEDFDNWDNINAKKTDCLIDTKEGRAVFWGSRPLWPAQYTGSMSMNTRSHGGGYSPKYDEYWYPYWSRDTIYRYNRNGNQISSFNTGQNQMMQVWGDRDGTYYTANWGSNTITKRSDMGSGTIWTYWIGTTAGAVCCDDNYVYAMGWCQTSIHILNKNNGQKIREYNLQGSTRCYGSLAYANGLLYIGGYNNDYSRVGIVNAQTGDYMGDFRVQENIYNMAYNGEEYLISSNGGTVYKYKISNGNSYHGTGAQPPSTVNYVQSKVLYSEWPTVGAFRIKSYEHKPQGTNIRYNISYNGKNWVTIANNTTYYPADKGSYMMWNATMTTGNDQIRPYIDRISIEFDLVETPIPYGPNSSMWQGSRTPTLVWNFTDPDMGDHQSDYLVEIFNDSNMENLVYNSSWVNSTDPQHMVREELDDGAYYWRVKTKDSMHAASNYSGLKKIMIDVTKPLGHIIIEEGAFSVNEELVELEIYAMDNTSGMVDMQIINDLGVADPWEDYDTTREIELSPTDGMKTIGVRFRDTAGVISDTFNDTVYLDLLAPVPINITSPTHPDPEVYYNSMDPVFQWEPPFEVTGIKGYSYTLDTSPRLEPAKVVYTQNNGINITIPGEFPGLIDGSWYFHIACCDVYDQWGNTTHFQVNIDLTDPVILEVTPDNRQWYNVSSIKAGAMFEDIDGFGLDVSSIQYSIKNKDGTSTPWTGDGIDIEVVETGIRDNPRKVRARVDLDLTEGTGNSIRWRVFDLSGNGPVMSDDHDIKADLTGVVFMDPVPPEDEISNEDTVSCGISISDGEGSGVDGRTVQYSISHWGSDPGYFINWTPISNNNIAGTLEAFTSISFDPGKNNYIKWRAKDAVGNGYRESDPYRVRVNSPPIPVIYNPYDGQTIRESEVLLNATGTYDNEGDELFYYWEIKNGTSKKRIVSASGMKAVANLMDAGKYLVYLHVDDGHGFNVSTRIDIYFKPTTPVIVDPNGIDNTVEADGIKESIYAKWRWHMVAGGCFLLLLILVIVVIVRKRKAEGKEEAEMPQPISGTERPYSMGTRDFHRPGYSEMYRNYQSPPKYRYPEVSGPSWSGGMRGQGGGYQGGPPSIAPSAPADRPALPMYTETSQVAQIQGSVPTPAPQVPRYQQPIAQSPAVSPGPSYMLPTFDSDEGTQNLNVKALPPAPVEGMAGAVPSIPTESSGMVSPEPAEYIPPSPTGLTPQPSPILSSSPTVPGPVEYSMNVVQGQGEQYLNPLEPTIPQGPVEPVQNDNAGVGLPNNSSQAPIHFPEHAGATPDPVRSPPQDTILPPTYPEQDYIPPQQPAIPGPGMQPSPTYQEPIGGGPRFDEGIAPASSPPSPAFPLDRPSQTRSDMVRGMSLFARSSTERGPSSAGNATRPEPTPMPPIQEDIGPSASPPSPVENEVPPPQPTIPDAPEKREKKNLLDDIFGGGN